MAVAVEKRQWNDVLMENLRKPFPDGLSLAEHLIAGATATGVAVFAMHPMDTIKTFIQKVRSPELAATMGKLNLFSATATIMKESGFLAFYRGVGPNVMGQAPAGAVKFAVFEGLSAWADRNLFANDKIRADLRPIVDLTNAALAFCICSVVLVPGEVLKQRLQAGVYPNFKDAIQTILRKEGPRGFYTGFSATLARDVPYTMFEFGFYHQFKRILRWILKREKLSGQEELLMGGLAGGFTGFLTTPLDLAKTKLMTQTNAAASQQYDDTDLGYGSYMEVVFDILKKEGVSGLFRGASARVIWLIPFTAIYFGVHEKTKRTLLNRSTSAVQLSRTITTELGG